METIIKRVKALKLHQTTDLNALFQVSTRSLGILLSSIERVLCVLSPDLSFDDEYDLRQAEQNLDRYLDKHR